MIVNQRHCGALVANVGRQRGVIVGDYPGNFAVLGLGA